MVMSDEFNNDHDALITLISEVRQLSVEIKEMKESSVARLERLEATTVKGNEMIMYKAEIAKNQADHESRLRILETFKSVIFGGLILSNVIIVPIIIWLVIKQLG